MREIKFRAWNSAEKRMYFNVGIEPHAGKYCVIDEDGVIYDMYGSAPALMQYTGINDKNGVQICEGDIVRFEHEREYEIGSVVFGNHNGAFCFRLPHIGIRTPMLNFMSTMSLAATYDFEIIGNVYETPDLISSEEQPE